MSIHIFVETTPPFAGASDEKWSSSHDSPHDSMPMLFLYYCHTCYNLILCRTAYNHISQNFAMATLYFKAAFGAATISLFVSTL